MALPRVALLALTVAAGTACYRPNIVNGGLGCSDAGSCPEGFVCSNIDNHCYKPDAGPSCPANMPHVAPVCDDPAAGGSTCNPACQTGCECGRCTVVGSAATCVDVGSKTEGSVCNPAADDCGSGLGCLRELCGTNLGRCHKFCRTGSDCSRNEFCSTLYGPSVVCDAPAVPSCNPITGNGCPDPTLKCYVSAADPICDCPGVGGENAQCPPNGRCAPGFTCVAFMGVTSCRPVCDSNTPVCTSLNPVCHPQFGTSLSFGYCADQ